MSIKQLRIAKTSAMVCGLLSACGGGGSGTTSEEISCGDAGAATLDEGNTGDLSNDIANPTQWALGAGANVLRASTTSGESDYVAFTVGPCDTLDSITVTDFTSTGNDNIAFTALQQGATFTIPAAEATTGSRIDELLGYSHYGIANLNQDILPAIGQGQGSIGFTGPLNSGTYTMWLNQTGAETQFTLVFNVSRVLP
jgi:hypothetical protein